MSIIRVLMLLLAFFGSFSAFSADVIAPSTRMEMWSGSNSMSDSAYTIGSTSAMGPVKTLKQTVLAKINLDSLDFTRYPGAYLDATKLNGVFHYAVSDNSNGGYPKQCVAFARSMTGAKTSNYWKRGTSLMDYLVISGGGYVLKNGVTLKPGTMIAYFRGLSNYPTSGNPGHVAIFLNWEYSGNKVVAANVVDQNLIPSVSINGYVFTAVKPTGTIEGQADGMIQKHFLPIVCTAGTLCTTSRYTNPRYYASNYHTVDIP